MTKEKIRELDMPREKGYLYYLGTSEDGNLVVFRSQMKRGNPKDGVSDKA